MFVQIRDEKLSDPLTYHSTAIIYMKYKDGDNEYTIINTPTFKVNFYLKLICRNIIVIPE